MSNYFIERVQIEGGFLDGLDLEVKNGLNAVIGARGTGKSTLVELIRYCLGIKGHTSESDVRALSHARSVLKDGQITLTLSDGSSRKQFSRTADDPRPQIPADIHIPLIFSQTEVETVGLLSGGRLNLIDGFLVGLGTLFEEEISTIAQIRSFSNEMTSMTSQLGEYEDQLLKLPLLQNQIEELAPKEKEILAVSEKAAEKAAKLNSLSKKSSEDSLTAIYINDYLTSGRRWLEEIESILHKTPKINSWAAEDKNPLTAIEKKRVSAILLIQNAVDILKDANHESDNLLRAVSERQSATNSDSQQLRAEIENLKKGAGEIARIGQILRKEKAKLEALTRIVIDKKNRINELRKSRDIALEKLETIRSKRSQMRAKKSEELSIRLAPKIRVIVEEASQLNEYVNVLMNSFKGSGIKYKDLAPAMAEAIPPRELLDIIESSDVESFISLVPISKNRALRVIQSLRYSVDEIATVPLNDEVIFELLDGSEYKDFNELSTGQRCTVILPVILEHTDTVLIIDQPEDHIDNAFIVDTLISAILRRSGEGQIIVTTHNANVPVLGEAREVIHLSSDGRRGFVLAHGALDNIDIVEAISSVMEGGREAFTRRSHFYGSILK
jgi:ABC-type Mn2+/Zn2+ transport system ATPase subunit